MQRVDAIPFLDGLLRDRDEHPITRHEAAEALGAIEAPEVFFFFGARTVDVMASETCARGRAPASFTSAGMCRSPGGSAAMVSRSTSGSTPGVRPVTPPGVLHGLGRTDTEGDEPRARRGGAFRFLEWTTGTSAGYSSTASGREGDDVARVRRAAHAGDTGPPQSRAAPSADVGGRPGGG